MKAVLLALISLSFLNYAYANESSPNQLQQYFGSEPIEVTPYDKYLKEITVGTKTYFASLDGRYIFTGPIFDTQSRQDIVEVRTKAMRHKMLAKLPKDSTLTYPATTQEKHVITVFTDIDCGYCRKLHSQIDAFNTLGVSVRYVMLPRAGINTRSFKKAVSALCSETPNSTMTLAMMGNEIDTKNCSNNVNQQMQLAKQLNITATPTILLPDGSLTVGYITADQLIDLLNKG